MKEENVNTLFADLGSVHLVKTAETSELKVFKTSVTVFHYHDITRNAKVTPVFITLFSQSRQLSGDDDSLPKFDNRR